MKLGEDLAYEITSGTLKIILTRIQIYIYTTLSPGVLTH